MYIKAHLIHKQTGIGATSDSTYHEQSNFYQEPSIDGITIVHRFNNDRIDIPYFLCTAADDFNVNSHSHSGVSSLTSTEWDDIIDAHDSNQEVKRYALVREMRNDALDTYDIYVIKQIECNVAITTEFRTWRQELRDLPNGNSFPINFPMAPSGVIGIITNGYYQNNLKSISMINDPIS